MIWIYLLSCIVTIIVFSLGALLGYYLNVIRLWSKKAWYKTDWKTIECKEDEYRVLEKALEVYRSTSNTSEVNYEETR